MNKKSKKETLKLSEFIEHRLRMGHITFTKQEAIKALGCSELAFMRASQRLQKKGHLYRPISGFYVIVEIEHRDAGGPPPIYFIRNLMQYLNTPYYLGLLTAAKYHEASHQAVMETQIVVPRPLPILKYGKHRVRFITNKFTEKMPKMPLGTPHGDIQISTPETTLFDLARYHKKTGGYSHIATVILEMHQKIKGSLLPKIAKIYNDTPLTQRVGYLLDSFGNKKFSTTLYKYLQKTEHGLIRLVSSKKASGKINKRWLIDINTTIEPDDV